MTLRTHRTIYFLVVSKCRLPSLPGGHGHTGKGVGEKPIFPPCQVLIRLTSAGVNVIDTVIRSGAFPAKKLPKACHIALRLV